jgi:RNA polymerase sigma factor (sigma-70 family)
MDASDGLAERFEAHRGQLRAVAYRMLGSLSDADDAVQEAWLRLSRTDTGGIDNLEAWLRTTVSRLCLDMLRARRSRREEPLDRHAPAAPARDGDPEQEALLIDSVGPRDARGAGHAHTRRAGRVRAARPVRRAIR